MNEKENKQIRFIDLFGGIGGFRHGLEKASSKRNKESRTDSSNTNRKLPTQRRSKSTFNCVWYCDKDKYAVETYNKNFKTLYEPIDIRQVKASNIPDFDMLCAGFPCQSFSVAGKRKGFEDTRGTLFFEICRVAQAKRPRMLFLENVKGLLSHDDGRTFGKILVSLDELGYDVEWQILNSKNFGVPQNRERVFIIGHLRGSCSRQVFPLRNNGEISAKTKGSAGPSSQTEISTTLKNKNVRSDDTFVVKCISGGAKSGGLHSDMTLVKEGEHCPMILSRSHGFNEGNIKKEPNMRFSSIQNELVIYDGHHHQFTKELRTLTGR